MEDNSRKKASVIKKGCSCPEWKKIIECSICFAKLEVKHENLFLVEYLGVRCGGLALCFVCGECNKTSTMTEYEHKKIPESIESAFPTIQMNRIL